jgi:hypothetical protein
MGEKIKSQPFLNLTFYCCDRVLQSYETLSFSDLAAALFLVCEAFFIS